MISSRLRARWRALTAIPGLDLLRSESDSRGQAAQAAAASAAASGDHVAEHRDSASAPAPGVVR